MKRTWMMGLIAVLTLALFANTTLAQDEGARIGDKPPAMEEKKERRQPRKRESREVRRVRWMGRMLDLDEEQAGKLKDIYTENSEATQEINKLVTEKREALEKLAMAEEPDMEAIDAAALELAQALAKQALFQAKIAKATKAIMNEEQLKKYAEFQKRRADMRAGRRTPGMRRDRRDRGDRGDRRDRGDRKRPAAKKRVEAELE
jgi:Spy/CpxP family protein refolding chaperone